MSLEMIWRVRFERRDDEGEGTGGWIKFRFRLKLRQGRVQSLAATERGPTEDWFRFRWNHSPCTQGLGARRAGGLRFA